MTEQVADAVVVGAGPAGCVMSYLLAKSGVETVLIERQQTLDRKFRGTGFRPPIPRLLDEMGLRSDLNDLPHETITQGTIVAHRTPYPVFDFEDDRILLMKQPPLLRLLVERAQEFDSFTFHSGTTFDRFRHEDDTIAGVRSTTRPSGETIEIRSRVVIGADGRYSTTRQAAGIDAGIQKTGTEIVWFRLPCAATDFTTHIRIENDGILVYSPLNEHESQYGLLIPRGQYSAIRDRGIERFRETISGIEPALATSVNAHLESFEQCSLLSVESGLAERWADNGFLLIGDAAHVASPIGAEGNNLAIQDAIAAHRTLTPALRHGDGPIAETILQQIEHARRPAVESTIDGQRSRGQGLSRLLTARERIPNVLEPLLVRGGAALISTIAQFSNGTAETNAPSVEQSLFCT